MKTVKIKGKDYVMVDERLKEFRKNYKGWALLSDIVELDEKSVTIRAIITDEDGKEIASGLAREKQDDGFINKTSFVENCETSAWGRALANLGIGLDSGVASAEEVENAIKQQESLIDPKLLEKAKSLDIDINKLKTYAEGKNVDFNNEYLKKAIEKKEANK